MKDILTTINKYREERGWTEYQLAEQSGLPQSTISSWYRKNMVPTVPSLEKICSAFGITLSQLFAEGEVPVSLTESQRKLLEVWARLTEEQQAAVFALIEKIKKPLARTDGFSLPMRAISFCVSGAYFPIRYI